jgi:hypothetical protein
MRRVLAFQAVALLASVGAFAQEPSLNEAQKQSYPAQQQEPAQHSPGNTTPPPPLSQPKAPIADQAAPAAVGPAQANTTSNPGGPAVLGATAQTMPSTMSEANAALDKKPITALQFPLTDQQRRLIADSVIKAPNVKTDANLSRVHVATFLPIGIPMRAFSDDLAQQVPGADRYKYVKLDDRILIVDPTVLSVVGEIKP